MIDVLCVMLIMCSALCCSNWHASLVDTWTAATLLIILWTIHNITGFIEHYRYSVDWKFNEVVDALNILDTKDPAKFVQVKQKIWNYTFHCWSFLLPLVFPCTQKIIRSIKRVMCSWQFQYCYYMYSKSIEYKVQLIATAFNR